ncbi:Flp family type IVb pilin [Acidisoma silvae]|uniref:Flp family type IVb pilin n=1 Tax=Acidisoma silvae TaxID=2802396 RepID=A0A963YSH6_9PROT|nr:Flp family type IVb pilin [Acidisoma silvae]MCB8875904.1 Flp family type IVb pilin [Acidisoma silvae]
MTNLLAVTTYCTNAIAALKSDKRGVTAVEYALIAGLIAAVIAVGVAALGKTVDGIFTSVNTAM